MPRISSSVAGSRRRHTRLARRSWLWRKATVSEKHPVSQATGRRAIQLTLDHVRAGVPQVVAWTAAMRQLALVIEDRSTAPESQGPYVLQRTALIWQTIGQVQNDVF